MDRTSVVLKKLVKSCSRGFARAQKVTFKQVENKGPCVSKTPTLKVWNVVLCNEQELSLRVSKTRDIDDCVNAQ